MNHGVWCLVVVLILLLFPVPDVDCELGTQPSKAQNSGMRFWTKIGCPFFLLFHLWYFAVFIVIVVCLFFQDFSYTWTPHVNENFSFFLNKSINYSSSLYDKVSNNSNLREEHFDSWFEMVQVYLGWGGSWQQEHMTRAPHILLDQAVVSLA